MSQNRTEIRAEIRKMILETFLKGAPESALPDDVSLERAHIVDSAKTLELIVFLEERFGLSVDNEDAVPENFDTVNAVVDYVARKLGVA